MTQVVLIRHAPTAWNAEGRIQGQTDVPLSPAGRAAAERWRVPQRFRDHDRFVSPLVRCLDTATRLDLGAPWRDPRLMEMHWGAWEGRLESDLEALGAAYADNQARGWDFRPPGGESRRQLWTRVRAWLHEVAARGQDSLAVTHNGVIRVVHAAATGWDLTPPQPVRFKRAGAHVFDVDAEGRVRLAALNVSLEPEP